jgi:hypothetical protein
LADPRKIYWDSCVWLGLINEEEDKLAACKFVIEKAKAGEVEIWTSTYTLAEVHKRKCEGKTNTLAEAQDHIFEEYLDQDFVVLAQVDVRATQPEGRVAPPEAGISGPPAALRTACGGLAPPRSTRLTGGPDIPVKWVFISAGWYKLAGPAAGWLAIAPAGGGR